MSDRKAVRTLERLYQIADAGEKGFATAAANIEDPALKIFFKIFAQQRLNFKNELLTLLRSLGETGNPGTSLPGAIHRGRVAVYAGLAHRAGQEQVILKETALGERVAVREYEQAIKSDLPDPVRWVVERQLADVRRASEEVNCLRSDEKRRAALRLAGSEQDTRQAIQSLVSAGISPDEIETTSLDGTALYEGKGATLAETVLSGAVGGALWGSLIGVLAGFGVVQTTSLSTPGMGVLLWVLTAIGFMLAGAAVAGALAFFIGMSIRGEDRADYPAIRENAHVLIHARACGT